MEKLIKQLKQFGEVELAEKRGEHYHFKITKGFSIKATNVTRCLDLILHSLPYDDRFIELETFVTDYDLFHMVLKVKTNEYEKAG